jgi:hypothetical protein
MGAGGGRAEPLGDQAGAVGVFAQRLDPLRNTAPLLIRQSFQFRHKPLKRFNIQLPPLGRPYPESSLSTEILNIAP